MAGRRCYQHRYRQYRRTWSAARAWGGNSIRRGIGNSSSYVYDLPCGNRISALHDGEECFPAMLQAIDDAQREVLLEMYWLASDKAGVLCVVDVRVRVILGLCRIMRIIYILRSRVFNMGN